MGYNRAVLAVAAVIAALIADSSLLSAASPLAKFPMLPLTKPVATTPPRLRLNVPRVDVNQLVFSPDSKLLVSLTSDRSIRFWDCMSGKQIATFGGWNRKRSSRGQGVYYYAFHLAPDGKSLIAAGFTSEERVPQIDVYDIETRKRTKRIPPPNAPRGPICLTPDGKTLILGGLGAPPTLVDVATGKVIETLPGIHPASSLALSPNGKLLATGHKLKPEGAVLWDLKKRKVQRVLEEILCFPDALAFSPDSKELAVAARFLTFYRLGEKVEVAYSINPQKVTGAVTSISYSRDGKMLAFVGDDPGLVLWNCAAKKMVEGFFGATKVGCAAVAISPDGKTVAAGAAVDTHDNILIWDIPQAKKKDKE